MPADYMRCVAAVKSGKGGRVITKTLDDCRYMHLCKDASGKWHKGEVKRKKACAGGGRGGVPMKKKKRVMAPAKLGRHSARSKRPPARYS